MLNVKVISFLCDFKPISGEYPPDTHPLWVQRSTAQKAKVILTGEGHGYYFQLTGV